MAIRSAGVKLELQGLAQYLAGGKQVDDANKRTKESLNAWAEAEKRATTAVRGAMQQRSALAKAESQERIQAAKATTARITEEERRLTATHKAELQQRAAAARQAAREQAAAQRAAAAAQRGASGGSFAERLGGSIVGGIGRLGLGFLGIQGAQQIISSAVELDTLRGTSLRTETALTALAGGGVQAAAAIRQIQSVAPGATTRLEAAQAATTIFTQKLNSSAVSLSEISKAISIIPQVSPSITSQADAIGQLTLFANSASFARADQLAVTAQDVKERVKELAAAFPELSESQLKAAATVQLVNERFAALGAAAAEQVTGVQSLSSAFADLKESIALGPAGQAFDDFLKRIANSLREVNVATGGGTTQDRFILLRQLQKEGSGNQFSLPSTEGLPGVPGLHDEANQELEAFIKQAEATQQVLERGGPGAQEFIDQLNARVDAVFAARTATEADTQEIQRLGDALRNATLAQDDFTQGVSESTKEFVDQQLKTRELNEARQQVDELAKSALNLFAQGAPGAQVLSEQLLELQAKLITSAELSEDDRAVLEALGFQHQLTANAAGQSVGAMDAAAQAKLNDAAAAFAAVDANMALAASINAIAQAQAGVSSGIIGDLSGLIGQGLLNPGQAAALNTVFQNKANTAFAALPVGLSPAEAKFAQSQIARDTSGAFLRDLQNIETQITKEAQEQHRAAQGASKEWNKAQKDAEKAAKAVRKNLEAVEGLFSPSKVTESQLAIAKAGGDVNLPDDFLRRFRDVSENFKKKGFREDFGEAQLAEARAALERIGVQPLEDLQGLFAQFEEAWANLSLFSSKENLALINQDAVQDQLRLQEQMEQGRKNIYELFGVAIEDATEAVSGGGGGIPPIDQEALQKRIEEAQQKFIEQMLTGLGVGPGGTSDSALATVVTGAGLGNNREDPLADFKSAIVVTGAGLGDLKTTMDDFDRAIVVTGAGLGNAAEVFATKVNDIPPVIWENHIEPFPKWKEDIIDAFPGWEHWLGPEKPNAPADVGASGTTAPTVPGPVQQGLTSPSVSSTTNNTKTTTVTISSTQSTGSLVADWAILQAQGAV